MPSFSKCFFCLKSKLTGILKFAVFNRKFFFEAQEALSFLSKSIGSFKKRQSSLLFDKFYFDKPRIEAMAVILGNQEKMSKIKKFDFRAGRQRFWVAGFFVCSIIIYF